MNFDIIGGRRHFVTWGCIVIASFMLWHDKISGGEWVTVMIACAAAYIAGGTAQKFKSNGVPHEPEINSGYQNRDRENGDRY